MKKLIIAEKPSLGQNIIAAIGFSKFKREDGYSESEQYIVTWAFGHLFSLYNLKDYSSNPDDPENAKWTLDGLPFMPREFKFQLKKDPKTKSVDSGVRKQYRTIKSLLARKDVDCVINAGDADREGEIIIRIILDRAGNKKPVMRLWMPDQTPDTIREELRVLKSDSEYNDLANEGYARTYMDWLYGINLTRLATLKSGTLLRVGRVVTPIVKAIYDRDMEIRNFVSKKYWGVSSSEKTNGEVIQLNSKRVFELSDKDAAEHLCETYNRAGAKVKDVKQEEKDIAAGKLYSLSKLQGELGKKYKMSPNESLAIVQTLYEKGYVTYPRTNSEYLAEAETAKINPILEKLKAKGYKVCPKDRKKSIYDDSKIESHSALTPTSKLPDRSDMREDEWKVYETIFNRFLAVFCSEPCRVNRTTIQIEVGYGLEFFTLKGDVFLSRGWMAYDDTGRSDKILPKLAAGDEVTIDFHPVEKETKPPKHYTVKSLNDYLKNPFRKEKKLLAEDEEDEANEASEDVSGSEEEAAEYKAMFEGVELGTEATRAGIIENAIYSKYIALKNNTYTILPAGEYYIKALEKLGIHMEKEKTAEMGKALKQVYYGGMTIRESVDMAFTEIRRFFKASEGVTFERSEMPKGVSRTDAEVLGKCPKCGSDVIERKIAYSCSNRDCRFAIFKDDKYFAAMGKKPTAANVKGLLNKGQISLKNCTSKAGKKYDCIIKVDFSGRTPQYTREFDNSGKAKKTGNR